MDLRSAKRKCGKVLADYRHAKRQHAEEYGHLFDLKAKVRNTLKAQEFVQKVAQKVQQEAHEKLTGIVTRCLKAVFDDPYEFRIEFVKKRGKTEAVLGFVDQKGNWIDPVNGTEGGVLDVASFALRLACIMLQSPRRRRLIVADEPFRFVSDRREYRDRVRELIETLAKELDFQFILVTHDSKLEAGKVINLG